MLLDDLKPYRIYLASKSPRRHQLMSGMDINYEYLPLEVEEHYPEGLSPIEIAEYLSRLKLSPISKDDYLDRNIFIACDTIVVSGDSIIGKPQDANDAVRILRTLSGKEHTVVSGLTVMRKGKFITSHKTTLVKFKELTEVEITYYIDRYKPMDKAGAYGIQEWIGYIGIEYVEGSFYNIMGLPTKLLWDMLAEIIR